MRADSGRFHELADILEKWGIFYSISPPITTSRATLLPGALSHVIALARVVRSDAESTLVPG